MHCGDCDQLLTEVELLDPFYNAVWAEICFNCFEAFDHRHERQFDFQTLEDVADTCLLSVEKVQGIICKIRKVISD